MIKFKIILVLFIVIFLSPGHLKAEEILFKKDAVLKKISEALPSGWDISGSSENLIFERAGTVSVLFENKINAEDTSRQNNRTKKIKNIGKETKCRLIFRCEPVWPTAKLKNAETANEEIYQKIREVEEKNNMQNLRKERPNSKNAEQFTAKTPEDKEKLEKYEKEKSELELKLTKLPDHNTELYGLFFVSESGVEDEFHSVSPAEASQEAYRVKNIIGEYCKNR